MHTLGLEDKGPLEQWNRQTTLDSRKNPTESLRTLCGLIMNGLFLKLSIFNSTVKRTGADEVSHSYSKAIVGRAYE